MSQDVAKTLWQLEEQFWLGAVDFYAKTLAPDALMVLPQPVGVLGRDATIESIRAGNRWQNVAFTQQSSVSAGEATVVLIYVAHADRGAPNTSYVAQCSSTYAREQGRWLLAAHHQSPLIQA